jgi:hypothetical protein
MEKSVQSEAHNWDRLGSADAALKTTRLQATPVQDWPWSRRVSVPRTWNTGDSTEQEDIVQMLIDPNSNLAMSQAAAMRRAYDDEIIARAIGTALDGDGNNVNYPAGQQVGDYTLPISFDMITEVSEKFLANDIDPMEPKVFVIGPKQARKLLQLTEATSADFNALRPLQTDGIVRNWMGYTWIVSTRLLYDATDPVNHLNCMAFTKKAIGLQVNRDISSRVAEDPSISFAWRIYTFATFGAVRVEDEHMVRIRIEDSI